MTAVIFIGPSLPLERAREVFPDAVYLPPAKQSDILSAIGIYKPEVIGLVDGEFGQSLSVWHKEILYALSEGIPVYGSSSMGALRAAETDAFGMVGVGQVYRMFASGELTDDDEVALAHGRDDLGYRALSEPLVNIRVTLGRAREAGLIDAALCARLIAIAKAAFFPERSFAAMLRAAAEQDAAPAETLAALKAYVARHRVDAKREDALELLRTIRDLPRPVPRHEPTFRMERSYQFEVLYQRERAVRHGGSDVQLAAVATHAALQLPDYTDLHFDALNRALVPVLADAMGAEAPEEEVDGELRRFRVERRLTSDAALAGWLAANDLSAAELRALMRERALCRVMHRWLVARKKAERSVKFVLDELRLRGRYEGTARAAAAAERVLAERAPDLAEEDAAAPPTPQLVLEHLRATPCRMATSYQAWAEEGGFHSLEGLRLELVRARLVRRYLAEAAAAVPDDGDADAEPDGAGVRRAAGG